MNFFVIYDMYVMFVLFEQNCFNRIVFTDSWSQMTLAPHDIVLERSCRLTWFVILGCGTFPAPPSTGSAIKTVSTLKMSPADIVSPLAFSRDTDKF